MSARQPTVIEGLQYMHQEFKNSPYFGTEDLKAIQAEISRQNYENPDEQRLREMIHHRHLLIEQVTTRYGLMSRCPDLLSHFAQGLEDMQDALDRMVAEREERQRARIDYE